MVATAPSGVERGDRDGGESPHRDGDRAEARAHDRDADCERDHVLGVEEGERRSEREPDTETRKAAGDDEAVVVPRPGDGGERSDPGGDHRRDAEIRKVDRRRKHVRIDEPHQPERPVHNQRRSNLADRGRGDELPRRQHRECHREHDREPDERRQPQVVIQDV